MSNPATKLLVSVRNKDESLVALRCGAHLIDVKEPNNGSLGAAESRTIAEVVEAVAGMRPVSAALGELNDLPPCVEDLPAGLCFFKIGLAGCRNDPTWRDRWIAACQAGRRSSASPVAVVYADWETAQSPSPEEILDSAGETQAKVLLVDTFDKSLPGLTRLWTMERIARLVNQARERSMEVVLAGKVSMRDAVALRAIGPDYIAVRSAVCKPDRNGPLDEQLLQELLSQLRPS